MSLFQQCWMAHVQTTCLVRGPGLQRASHIAFNLITFICYYTVLNGYGDFCPPLKEKGTLTCVTDSQLLQNTILLNTLKEYKDRSLSFLPYFQFPSFVLSFVHSSFLTPSLFSFFLPQGPPGDRSFCITFDLLVLCSQT